MNVNLPIQGNRYSMNVNMTTIVSMLVSCNSNALFQMRENHNAAIKSKIIASNKLLQQQLMQYKTRKMI